MIALLTKVRSIHVQRDGLGRYRMHHPVITLHLYLLAGTGRLVDGHDEVDVAQALFAGCFGRFVLQHTFGHVVELGGKLVALLKAGFLLAVLGPDLHSTLP